MFSEGMRVGAAVAAVGLALLAGACGGDGGDAPEKAEAGPQAKAIDWERGLRLAVENSVDPTTGGDRAQIRESLLDLQINFAASRRFIVCGELTKAGWGDVAALQGRSDFQACKNMVAKEAERRRRRDLKTELSAVLSVKITGDHAVVEVRGLGGETRNVPVVREAGAWRITALHYAIPDALVSPPPGPGHDKGDPTGMDDRAAVEEAVYDVQATFPRGLGDETCEELSADGRREVEAAEPDGDCAATVQAIAERVVLDGFQPRSSRILAVDVEGDRATALLKDRLDSGKPSYRVPLVREDGAWRLTSLTHVEPIDLEPSRRGEDIPRDFGDPPGLDARGEIEEALSDVQADFATHQPTTICADLSRAGQREMEALGSGERRTCANVVFDLARRNTAEKIAPRFSRLLSVRFEERLAHVLVSDPGKPAYEVPFVREDERWRLVSLARAVPIAAAMTQLRQRRDAEVAGS